MPEARRCGQTQHLREKRRRALLIFAPNDGVIEFDHKTSLRGLHQAALRDRRLDEGNEERMGREGLAKSFDLRLRMELYAHGVWMACTCGAAINRSADDDWARGGSLHMKGFIAAALGTVGKRIYAAILLVAIVFLTFHLTIGLPLVLVAFAQTPFISLALTITIITALAGTLQVAETLVFCAVLLLRGPRRLVAPPTTAPDARLPWPRPRCGPTRPSASRRSSRRRRCPSSRPAGSCCRRFRAAPAPAGSRRWRTDSRDPNDAAGPAAGAGEPTPSRGRRGW